MHKYLWVVPLIVLVLVMAGCHGEGGPTIRASITAPQQGDSIDQGTTVTVTVTVTASAGAAKVEFAIDGVVVDTDNSAPFSYTWNTTGVAIGNHIIAVTAYDQSTPARTATGSVTVAIAQPPTAPPTVEITGPTDGATVSGDFDVEVTATPQEPGATIDHIDITADSTTKTISGASGMATFNVSELSTSSAKATVAPAQAFMVSVQNATIALAGHTITAVATDSLGVTGSASITVNTGGTTTVSVHLSDTSSVAGFQMTINYDEDVLKLVGGAAGVQKGAAVTGDNILQANADTAGQIIAGLIGVGAAAELDNTKTEILTLEFQAIGAAGTTVISIDDTDQAPAKLTFGNTSIPPQPITPLPTAVPGTITIQ